MTETSSARAMRAVRATLVAMTLYATGALAQVPTGTRPPAQPGTPPGRGGGRGGGRGRAIQVMTLTTTAFPDGGVIPAKYAQPGRDVSPPLHWTGAPDSTRSFVLLVHDIDFPIGNGTDDLLHWMVWNIPATATSLPEGVPAGAMRADGSRQISASGPYYRGPAAPASGPPHHYVFEVFALDTTLDIPATGISPRPNAQPSPVLARDTLVKEMAGHIRAKGALVGTFRRAAP